ncbi:hypothetical protein [Candidatus Aciduliprofundum boonei]|uniref:Uncharacterized protein n=1 Tax=Aciduliprofundum boonei (strain DSM 19572 / T469) TaxID=439481 RepID=D3T9U4_ACIB4|nr:hypothetical protein [Candidatus Aciduliprofundum boonei]ADD08873.1 hypothetical protein Aboo_1064 [Aciduliprofundum boonei T469]HII55624.1 hypothetical protein [Candidatus Aciduliprofundum boonei]
MRKATSLLAFFVLSLSFVSITAEGSSPQTEDIVRDSTFAKHLAYWSWHGNGTFLAVVATLIIALAVLGALWMIAGWLTGAVG